MEVLVGSTYGVETAKNQSVDTAQQDAGIFFKEERCVRSPSEENDDVSSQERWLKSFSSSLEDSLPIKRGLSNHYIGKSKSFGNITEVKNVKDLEKVESPFNKKRRLLIANKLRRRSSLSSFCNYSNINPNSMPLLALQESDEHDFKYNDDHSDDDETIKLEKKRMKMTNSRDFMVKTQSCFSFASFQEDCDR